MLIIGIMLTAAAIYALTVAVGVTGTSSASVKSRLVAATPRVVEAEPDQKVKVEGDGLGPVGLITPRFLVTRLERNLLLAGRPPGWTVQRAVLAKPVFTGVALLLGLAIMSGTGSGLLRLVVVGFVVLAYFTPDLLVYNRGVKRQQQMERDLPDTLDQVTISIEAGLGFEAALDKAGKNGKGPLADEFVRLIQDVNLGMSRRNAYEALGDRTSVADLRRFAKSIVQAEEQGVPIASVVRMQAKEMRLRRRTRAEARAQQVPVKILLPLMAFILPVLFIIVLGPPVTNAFRIN